MSLYTAFFVRFLHGAVDAFAEAEAFVFHTRLAHVSASLRDRNVTRAVDRLSLMAEGIGGGTKIGDSLAEAAHIEAGPIAESAVADRTARRIAKAARGVMPRALRQRRRVFGDAAGQRKWQRDHALVEPAPGDFNPRDTRHPGRMGHRLDESGHGLNLGPCAARTRALNSSQSWSSGTVAQSVQIWGAGVRRRTARRAP